MNLYPVSLIIDHINSHNLNHLNKRNRLNSDSEFHANNNPSSIVPTSWSFSPSPRTFLSLVEHNFV